MSRHASARSDADAATISKPPARPRGSISRSGCGCITSIGATPARRRCCWCMAGATIAATGTGWRRRCAATGTSSRPICAAMATASGRPTATTRSPAYIYDLAQLIHQQELAPVTIVAHSLGGNIACATPASIPRTSAGWSRSRGSARRRRRWPSAPSEPIAERMQQLDRRAARAVRPPAAPLCLDRGRLQAHAGGQPPSVARAGAASDPARRQPERGRHLQLEVRQLRARRPALRHDPGRDRGSCGRGSPARPCWSTARKAGPPTRRRTAASATSRTPRSSRSRAPATGCITTGSTASSTCCAAFCEPRRLLLGRQAAAPSPAGNGPPASQTKITGERLLARSSGRG